MKKNCLNSQDETISLKRKYRLMQGLSVMLIVTLCTLVYFNYDYMVFKLLISKNYVYTSTLDEIYTQILGEENIEGYTADFDRVVISVVTEKLRDISGDKYTYLYTPYGYKTSKEQDKEYAAKTEKYALTEDLLYLKFPNFSKGSRAFFIDNKSEIKNYSALVLDLRDNYGGMLEFNYEIARLFLDKNMILATENTRLPIFNKVVKAKKEPYFNFEKIFILLNENTASSSEAFTMALKENLDNVVLIGSKSFGKGIGQITVPLTDGYAVKATVVELKTPQGGSIQNIGIEPDIISGNEDSLNVAIKEWTEKR